MSDSPYHSNPNPNPNPNPNHNHNHNRNCNPYQVSDSDSAPEEGPQQAFLFPVPSVEQDEVSEQAVVRGAYSIVDRLSYLDWGLNSADAVGFGKRRCVTAAAAVDTWQVRVRLGLGLG